MMSGMELASMNEHEGLKIDPELSLRPLDHEAGEVYATRLDPSGLSLLPIPTDDQLDPLNWSTSSKSMIIFIVTYFFFMFTYMVTAVIPSFALLEEQFNTSYTAINWTFAIPNFGLAVGPLLCGALANTYGRRPVMIGGTIIALIASGFTSLHGISYGGYMACRLLQGLGCGPASNVGLTIINDISFQHERGKRIGYWTMAASVGSIVATVTGGFLALVDQYWIAYHVVMLFAVLLFLELFFLPETLYPRRAMTGINDLNVGAGDVDTNNARGPASPIEIKRTQQLGYFSLQKVPGVPHPQPWDEFIQFGKLWAYPTIVLSINGYCFLQYTWFLSFLTMEPAAYANYKTWVQGLLTIGILVGVLVAEMLCSGRLSDRFMAVMAKKNGGLRVPENRLWFGYPAALSSALGLLLWGLSVDRQWHWFTGQVAFFLFGFGLQIGNTVVSTYVVDKYPDHANEVITFYSVIVNLSAFVTPWYINLWVEAQGYTLCFAIQAIICFVLLSPVYIFLQKFGPKMTKALH